MSELAAGLRGFKVREAVIPILERTGMKWETIISRRRFPHIVSVRHEIFFTLREMGCSLVKIGLICEREHTTVMHGIEKHKEKLNEGYI